ncbi:putative DNA-dependent RNA polymerase [Aeromonas phage LAh2]|uniref:DNA-directed RNA polymerase n=1 Tax=Aeromonas phage LAh1 TaxID=2591024 RepID=A0A513ZZ13_9CAUD|nr:putative DNA-dependent RNA polymerase [Aeromonas phage LAh1]QDH46281.1 putative DNA-dependent RNA polymerase [Aeromonas phage LAh2]QDH46326.1 putative DNA-dependent RNA polymerase [Aeromonas phage LAh3]QDH46376.1 putative DNA-dependent RNA polymerase [Aeromonas phage LAh4]QDH46428.1 putative DNA-dependent RNA polymerase [Aeromonas phage LAh5]
MATIEDQLAWETRQRQAGRDRMQAMLRTAEEKGRVTDTPLGTSLLRRHVLNLSHRLATELTVDLGKPGRSKAHSPLLKDLEPDAVMLIALSTTLNHMSTTKDVTSFTRLSTIIGKAIYSELVLCHFKDMEPELFETLTNDLKHRMSKSLRHRMTVYRMQAEKNGVKLPEWGPATKVQVGSFLVGLLVEEGLLHSQMVWVRNKSTLHVVLNRESVEHMAAMQSRLINMAGRNGPLLIPPRDWDEEGFNGGYYGDMRFKCPRFFKGTSQQLEFMKTEGTDLTTVLTMLNYHQKVKWRINNRMLGLVKNMVANGFETDCVISKLALIPPERPDFLDAGGELTEAQSEAFTKWKRLKRDWHTKTMQRGKKAIVMNGVLREAEELAGLMQFYFAYQADDRSRMYAVCGSVNPQGSDLQKAMLQSAVGCKLEDEESIYWFKLGIASKFGIDKESLDDCVNWVESHRQELLQCAAAPLDRDAYGWWSGADKPLQFLAACFEYAEWTANPDGFVSRLAVPFDGTCNGLQNYSAILRDEVGGRATNLLSEHGSKPNDIYGDVAGAAATRNEKAAPTPAQIAWRETGFNRSLTKKSTMTLVYGSTYGTCRKSIIDYCTEHELFEDDQRFDYADYAGKLVWAGIGDVVVKAKEAMDWLQKVARMVMKEGGEYITWVAPSGFRVVQTYNKMDDIRVWTHTGGKKVRLQLLEETERADPIRHRNGFPPNFIHSVDASHMAFTTNGFQKRAGRSVSDSDVEFMHFIHDDFGALPNRAGLLYRTIREEFVSMHTDYSLDMVRKEYPFVPSPPKLGNLDLHRVLDSPNFFR